MATSPKDPNIAQIVLDDTFRHAAGSFSQISSVGHDQNDIRDHVARHIAYEHGHRLVMAAGTVLGAGLVATGHLSGPEIAEATGAALMSLVATVPFSGGKSRDRGDNGNGVV